MENLTRLSQYLEKLAGDGLCVAFSGGVDSAVVLKAALGLAGRVHGVTMSTPFVTQAETEQARRMAKEIGAPHTVIRLDELPETVMANPTDRCYHCKLSIFQEIGRFAQAQGLGWVLDGTNADDLTQYRPGLRALRDLGVRSPLAELGFSKPEVRAIASELGLAVAAKPAAPCLATRIPYGTPIDMDTLSRIDRVEQRVKALGPQVVRARAHGDTIRLEVMPEEFPRILEGREALLAAVREAGFDRLALDLAGYRSGSFDQAFLEAGEEG